MTKSDAIAYYGGNISALARAIGIDQSTVYSWGESPPDRRQLQLQRITKGKLRAEPGCKERVLGLDIPAAANDTPEPAKAVG